MNKSSKMLSRALSFKLGLLVYDEFDRNGDISNLSIQLDILLEHNNVIIKKHEDSQLVNMFVRTCMEELLAPYIGDKIVMSMPNRPNHIGIGITFDDYVDILDTVNRYNSDNNANKQLDTEYIVSIQIVSKDSSKYVKKELELRSDLKLTLSDIPDFIEDKQKCLICINNQLEKIVAHEVLGNLSSSLE